jgi:hypothetical protein
MRNMPEYKCEMCGKMYIPKNGTSMYCDICSSIYNHKHRCGMCGKRYYSGVEHPTGLCKDCMLGRSRDIGNGEDVDMCHCCGVYPIARDRGLTRLCWICFTTGNDGVPEEFCNIGIGEALSGIGELGELWEWM